MAERVLLPQEIVLATRVFSGTLPIHLIRIADDLGLDDRAWCAPPQISFGNYVIHLGVAGFIDATSTRALPRGQQVRNVFIHELVHAWQGYHDAFPPGGYFLTAGWLQCTATLFGADIYSSAPGKAWFQYNPEQQGNIVMEWFMDGMPTTGPLWGYIAFNIRKGDPFFNPAAATGSRTSKGRRVGRERSET